jgi:hypothetical protein
MIDIYKQLKALDRLVKGTLITAGTIWYVNGPTGIDTNSGQMASSPFKTIAKALTKVNADADDYIIVLDSWDQDTFPITVNKSRCHIIGLDMGCGWPQLHAATDLAIFNVTKNNVEIAGLSLEAPAQTTAHGLVECKTFGMGHLNLHHCFLGHLGAGYHGVVLDNAGYSYIHDNLFGHLLAGKGIYGIVNKERINDNAFHGVGSVAIQIDDGPVGEIVHNRIVCAGTDGTAIYLTVNSKGLGLIDDNRAMTLAAACSGDPFRDLGTPKANWGMNYKDIRVTLPKTT